MKRLKELRLQKGVPQQKVAKYLGVSRQAYSNYENGNRNPDNEVLLKLAEFFEVSVDYLLRGDEALNDPGVTDPENDLKAAFFEGAEDLPTEELEMLWQDAKEYINYKIEQRRRKK